MPLLFLLCMIKVEVLQVDVRGHCYGREEEEERTIALVRLGKRGTRWSQAARWCPGLLSLPPITHVGIKPGGIENWKHKRGGRGLAWALQRRCCTHSHQLSEHLCPGNDRMKRALAAITSGCPAAPQTRQRPHARRDIFFPVTVEDLCAKEASRSVTSFYACPTCHENRGSASTLGEPLHPDATDADEMYLFYFLRNMFFAMPFTIDSTRFPRRSILCPGHFLPRFPVIMQFLQHRVKSSPLSSSFAMTWALQPAPRAPAFFHWCAPAAKGVGHQDRSLLK